MLTRIRDYFVDSADRQRIAIALAKGAAMMQRRRIDLRHPESWEFSGFSQNGEDGIIDVLRSQLRQSNRSSLEVGCSSGMENNTSWLVVCERYCATLIDGNAKLVARAARSIVPYSIGSRCMPIFASKETVPQIIKASPCLDPDVFSMDIDGNDYYIVRDLFAQGLRPRIAVVEYNSVYGPNRPLTVPYDPEFVIGRAHPSALYYGVAIAAWTGFFAEHGYRFVGVDRNGVNAFFVDPGFFDAGFLDAIAAVRFVENRYQLRKFAASSDRQFKLIAGLPFVTIEGCTASEPARVPCD